MKTKLFFIALFFIALSTLNLRLSTAFAQGTAFTYQGRLNDGAIPANGTYDLRFLIYDSTNNPGTVITGPLTNSATSVSNGLFTATLDFGASVFTGLDRWLEISVRSNGGSAFATLSPRQKITPTPYAIMAASVSGLFVQQNTGGAPNMIGGATNNFASSGVLGATIGGGGAIHYDLNGDGDPAESFHNNVTGNFGTVGGGGGNNAGLFSTVAGGSFNTASGPYSMVAGGGVNAASGNSATVSGGSENVAGGDYATVGGGEFNTATNNATVGGGYNNSASGNAAAVGGGNSNNAGGNSSTVSGGLGNTASAMGATVSGGQQNVASGSLFTTVGGGFGNTASGLDSTAGGGSVNTASGDVAAISGGLRNLASGVSSTVGGGEFNTNSGDFATIGGGEFNKAAGFYATVSGGNANAASGSGAVISGGGYSEFAISGNTASGSASVIGGGVANTATQQAATIGGGYQNSAGGYTATVPGGNLNSAAGDWSFAAGFRAKANHQGAFVWADSLGVDFSSTANDQFLIRASGGVGIGTNNPSGATLNVSGIARATAFQGDGNGLVNLNAANLTATVPDARLSANVVLLNANQIFAGQNNFNNSGNSFSGNGSGLGSVNALTLGGIGSAGFWKIAGNAGTTAGPNYLGTTDNQPLEFHVNGARALRLEPNSSGAPNVIGGASVNFVTPGTVGAVIAGGGATNYGAGAAYVNSVSADFGTIGGGYANTIQAQAYESTIGGGFHNSIQSVSADSTIAGGTGNTEFNSDIATIGGGDFNSIQNALDSTIGGGDFNSIQSASEATIGGGDGNLIQTASYSTIGGGSANLIKAGAAHAVIPGGYGNLAAGNFSLAAGQQAQALHQGAFVWADSQSATFASTANDQFLLRAAGGAGINTTNPMGNALCVNGDTRLDVQPLAYNEGLAINCPTNMLANGGFGGIHFHSTGPGQSFSSSSIKWSEMYNYAPEIGNAVGGGLAFIRNNNSTALYLSSAGNVGIGTLNPTNKLMVVNARCDGSSWINASDRNLKQGFAGVDAQMVLARVAALPVTTWSYKTQPEQKHLGPVAQDFRAAFGLGQDDTSISTVDESGVALAAIQGLNQKLNEKDARISALEKELSELKEAVKKLADKKD
jgi:trimeric autotransporter adhesin